MKTSPTNRSRKLSRGWAYAVPSLLVLCVLVLYPLATLFVQTFLPHLFDVHMSLKPSIEPLIQSFSDKLNYESLVNSFVMGLFASIAATVVGTLTAFGSVRAPSRYQRVLDTLVWVVFFAPSYVIAEGWLQFLQDGGIASQLFGLPNGWAAWFFTKPGLVVLMGLRYFPFVHLAMTPAIKNMGGQFERAARSMGAGKGRVFWRITFPLLAPATLAGASIAFAEGFGDFGFASAIAPTVHIPLLTYQIYSALNQAPVNYAAAGSLSLVLVVVMGAVLWFQMWWLKRRSYTTVSSSTSWNESTRVVKVQWYTTVSFILAGVSVVIPVLSTIATSMWKTGADGIQGANWTLHAYAKVLQTGSDGLASLERSIVYSAVAAVVTMIIALYVSYQLSRRDTLGMRFVNVITMATIAVPGVVLAAGFIFAWNAVWLIPIHLVLYGTSLCLGMAYIAGSLPYAIRLDLGAISQLSPNLMTAAQVLGAKERVVMSRIVLPLIGGTIVSTFFIALTGTMFELPASSLLYPAGEPPFPVEIQQQFNAFNFNVGSAMATIGMLIVFIMYGVGRYVATRMRFVGGARVKKSHLVKQQELITGEETGSPQMAGE
ncbi:ABC transporter permease [Alicyclobacillus ferrooxydans]|nr:ABC transporter permease subunit [Alicyclobacillus ferrooxydans]